MKGINTSFNQIILILILFTTFFHFVYNCLVHTDLVVAYKPYTPRTYQDIIDNETAKIDFKNQLLLIELFFEQSAKSSPDRNFCDKIKHRKKENMPKEYIEKYNRFRDMAVKSDLPENRFMYMLKYCDLIEELLGEYCIDIALELVDLYCNGSMFIRDRQRMDLIFKRAEKAVLINYGHDYPLYELLQECKVTPHQNQEPPLPLMEMKLMWK